MPEIKFTQLPGVASVNGDEIIALVQGGESKKAPVNAITLDKLGAPSTALNMNSQKLSGLANGTLTGDAINKGQLDTAVGAVDVNTPVNNHINDSTAAHPASAISTSPGGNLSSDNVAAALNELDGEKAGLSLNNTFSGQNIFNSTNTFSGTNTFSAKQIFSNTLRLDEVLEKVTITASAPTGTFDCLGQGVQYFTTSASVNWTQNFRGDGSTTLNSVMAAGEAITVTLLVTTGATGYLPTAHQVDGASVTIKLLGGSAWTVDANSIVALTYTIVKTADATFVVLASKSKYA
jgi:hypothetical protein